MTDGPQPDYLGDLPEQLRAHDVATREQRAERIRALWALLADFPPWVTGIQGGGTESSWLLTEAIGCFREGFFGATLLCAHASCERELAGRVAHHEEAPAGWEKWGLGQLLNYAAAEEWFSTPTQALLEQINEKRRHFYHYRAFLSPESLVSRTLTQFDLHHKDEVPEHLRLVLRQDATEALRAAFLVRTE